MNHSFATFTSETLGNIRLERERERVDDTAVASATCIIAQPT